MVRSKLELNENLELECMPLDTISLLFLLRILSERLYATQNACHRECGHLSLV